MIGNRIALLSGILALAYAAVLNATARQEEDNKDFHPWYLYTTTFEEEIADRQKKKDELLRCWPGLKKSLEAINANGQQYLQVFEKIIGAVESQKIERLQTEVSEIKSRVQSSDSDSTKIVSCLELVLENLGCRPTTFARRLKENSEKIREVKDIESWIVKNEMKLPTFEDLAEKEKRVMALQTFVRFTNCLEFGDFVQIILQQKMPKLMIEAIGAIRSKSDLVMKNINVFLFHLQDLHNSIEGKQQPPSEPTELQRIHYVLVALTSATEEIVTDTKRVEKNLELLKSVSDNVRDKLDKPDFILNAVNQVFDTATFLASFCIRLLNVSSNLSVYENEFKALINLGK